MQMFKNNNGRNFQFKSSNGIRRIRHLSDGERVLRIIVSFFIMLISFTAIYMVLLKTTQIKILEKINLKEESHDSISITIDTNSGTSFFITEEKGIKFKKEDKSFAREEWIEKNRELFYFDKQDKD